MRQTCGCHAYDQDRPPEPFTEVRIGPSAPGGWRRCRSGRTPDGADQPVHEPGGQECRLEQDPHRAFSYYDPLQPDGRRPRRDALAVERWNRLHPDRPARTPYLLEALEGSDGPVIAASDYMKVVADQIAPWLPGRMEALGTDGFGRSPNPEHLRRHFEINAESIAAAALSRLAREGRFDAQKAVAAFAELGVDTEKIDAARA